MPAVQVSIEGVAVRRDSGKPRLLVKTRRRKAVVSMLQAMKTLSNQEFLEIFRSATKKYNPYLVLDSGNSETSKAFVLLKKRLEDSLKAKA